MEKTIHSYKGSESHIKDECIKKEPSYDFHPEVSLPINITDAECNNIKQEKSTETYIMVKDDTALTGCFKEGCSMKKEVIVDLKQEFEHVNKSIHKYQDIQPENTENEDVKYDIDIKDNNLNYKVDNSNVQSPSVIENFNPNNMRITRSMASFTGQAESNFEREKAKDSFKHAFQKRTKGYKCMECNKLFSLKPLLRNHMRLEHKKIICMCDVCGKTFNTKKIVKNHIKLLHSGARNYECQECHKCYTLKSNLTRHMNVEHKRRKNFQYICNYCGKCTCRKDYLVQHMKSVHTKINCNIYTCLQCNKTFALKTSLNRHYKKHFIENYRCNECDKVYSWRWDIVRHINKVHMNIIHSDIKNVVCNDCNKTFSNKKYLVKHIDRIHKKIKNYECVFCRKTFFENSKLKRHLKSRKHKNMY